MAGAGGYAELLGRLAGVRTLGVDLGLERMRLALARLGDPQARFAAVQIAGTNGKGSTAAMTEAVLREAGLRTGLYSSPHLARFTERIRVDGQEANGDRLAALDRLVAATEVPLTYFEVATALAFLAMAEAGVEIAVLETGLGGRLDAVTTCVPCATAITSIGLDHTEYLGDTLAAIAREKAGILKAGVSCFLGRLPREADDEIARVAESAGALLFRYGQDFGPTPFSPALAGAHQKENAALAAQLARAAGRHLGRTIDDRTMERGLAGVRWPGRCERVGDDLLFDAAHNADGARALAAALPALAADRRVVLVVSIVGDKDAAAMFAALAPAAAAIVTTRSDNPRAVAAAELAAIAARFTADVVACDDPVAALAEARGRAGAGGLVVVCGSMFLVGMLRAHVLGEPVDPLPTSDPVGPVDPAQRMSSSST
ncbi:MAG TPA: cyanophycin synthetase [Polyangia bacterium]|jgi:dihydrofolate synthase/folylpolyglutamate synthase|nr:cyanophycin synthetase [Polyangia bacterium]